MYVAVYYVHLLNTLGPGSSVGTATEYGLDGQVIESRWGGEIFRRQHRPWGPPSLLYNGYRVFPGGRKRPERDVDPSPPSSAEVQKQSRAIPLLSLRAFVTYTKSETYLLNTHFAKPRALSAMILTLFENIFTPHATNRTGW